MKYTIVAYYYNAAFFAIIPYGNEFTIFHYDILVSVALFGESSGQQLYKYLHKYRRYAYLNKLYLRLEYLTSNGYLIRTGVLKHTKYNNTAKSLLLIAQVERKLAALVKAQKEANKNY